MNGVHSKLFALTKEDIGLTLDAARAKLGIDAAEIPDIQACLNLFLPSTFLAHMFDAMNRPYQTSATKITSHDMQVFLHILLLLHVYRCSPTTLFAELKHGANSLYGQHPELAGGEVIFSRCLNGLSYAVNSEHRGLEWNESQMLDSTIADGARCKSRPIN